MKLIVGSTALSYHGYSLKPSDIDIWTDEPFTKEKGYDCKSIPTRILELIPHTDGYATPDAIYTIKCSHLGWSNPMWSKHKNHILLLKHKGCSIIEELYSALIEYWKVELGDKSFLSLNKGKEDFFTDNVQYVYDHDYLHELVAYPAHPMYTKILKNNCDVMVDKVKFDMLDLDSQVRLFREEISVIALERWMIPRNRNSVTWNVAYSRALEKTITTLTKGWATEFIVRNLELFVKQDYSYFINPIKELKL